ncbi:hypothetical protein HT031_000994 [Scenedesmus sp. PABB004]|nr:hypothetical protein HT031_000994 [Scenedesmus sp. PABB004]
MKQDVVEVRGARGPAGEYGAVGAVELEQDAQRVYNFMRRVEDQPLWNAGVKVSKIVGRLTANTLQVNQVLAWNFLALRGDFNLALSMQEDPGRMSIDTQLLDGGMMRSFTSSVGVRRLGRGRCRLEMSLYMKPSLFVPPGIRHMVGGQVRRQLAGVLAKIKDTVEGEHVPSNRRSFELGFVRACDAAAIASALESHPLDISVVG